MRMTWMTNHGDLIELSKMSDEHVANCVIFILSGRLDPTCETCRFTRFTPRELRQIFQAELLRRARQRG